jgi:hypothetical protein
MSTSLDSAQPSALKRAGSVSQKLHIQRSFWVIIQDIEATLAAREHPAYKYRCDAKNASRLEALEVLIRDFSLQHVSKEGVLEPCDSRQLWKTFLNTWKAKKITSAAELPSPWVSGIKGWQPSYLESIKKACEYLTASQSLQSYNPDNAVSLSTDLVHEVQETLRVGQDPAVVRSNGGNSDPDAIEVYHTNTTSGSAYVDGTERRVRKVRPVNAALHISAISLLTSRLTQSSESTREAVHDVDADVLPAKTTSDGADEDYDDFFGSFTEAFCSTSTKPKRKRLTRSTNLHAKRPHAIEDTPSTTPTLVSHNNANDQAAIATWVVQQLGNSVGVNGPATAPNPSAALPPTSKPAFGHQNYERQVLIPLILSKPENELRDIYRKTTNAWIQFLDDVGEVGKDMMPFELVEPPSSTLRLHVRCWGDEWCQTRAKLRRAGLFSAPDVAMSLSSTYLSDTVFNCPMQSMQMTLGPAGSFASGSIIDGQTLAFPDTVAYD